MSEGNTAAFGLPIGTIDGSISKQAVFAGAILGILVNMSALLVPVLNYIGGGIVAGFVAAYIVGGPRGWLHGIIAGIIAGLVGGGTVAFTGALIGLYTEPPTLLSDIIGIGIVSPMFDGMGGLGLLFILLVIAAFIAADSVIGGAIGGLLRTMVDSTFRR
jgi:hypothetical protein